MDIRENISSVLSECIMRFVRIHDVFFRNGSSVSARNAVCCKVRIRCFGGRYTKYIFSSNIIMLCPLAGAKGGARGAVTAWFAVQYYGAKPDRKMVHKTQTFK